MNCYLVNLIDNKSNRLEDKEYYSSLNINDFKKWLRKELKILGYGKVIYLKVEKN